MEGEFGWMRSKHALLSPIIKMENKGLNIRQGDRAASVENYYFSV
jgi:hypothetical protein